MVDNSLFIPFFLIKIITQMLNQFKGTFTIFKNSCWIGKNCSKYYLSFLYTSWHHNLSAWMYLKYKWNVIILHIAKREGVKNLYFKKKMIYRDSKMLNIYIITICLTQIFAKWILFLLIIFSLTFKNNSWSVKSHYDSSFEHIYSMWISPILELETTFGQFIHFVHFVRCMYQLIEFVC